MESRKIAIYQIFTRLFGNKKWRNKINGLLEENGVGKFNDITPRALYEIKRMGFSHVWYTGVIEHATMTDYTSFGIKRDHPQVVKGIAGSPYAIKDYYDVNPDLAVDIPKRMKEFETLVARTHDEGLKVIIDLVPNHLAREYYSDAKPKGIVDFGENDDTTKEFDAANNFYYITGKKFETPKSYIPPIKYDNEYSEIPAKATGNDCFREKPYINDWFETVKLNYGVDYNNCMKKYFDPIPDTWIKMKEVVLYWLGKKVDGFRCDMVEMTPVEFWQWLIPQVKDKYPDSVFIAEIYNKTEYTRYIEQGKFDYLYDKVGLYDAVRDILEERCGIEKIKEAVEYTEEYSEHMLTFLENHDEQRIASRYFAGDMFAGIPGMFITSTIHRGPSMVYFGQEVGESEEYEKGFSGLDGRTTIFDYWGVVEHQSWMNEGAFDGGRLNTYQRRLRESYMRIINFSMDYEVFFTGKRYFVDVVSDSKDLADSVLAYLRYNDRQKIFLTANLSGNKRGKVTFVIPSELIGTFTGTVVFTDILFNKYDFEIEGDPFEGVKITLMMEPYAVLAFKITV